MQKNSFTDSETIEDIASLEFERRSEERSQNLSIGKLALRIMRRKRFWLLVAIVTLCIYLVRMHHYGHISPESLLHYLRLHPVIAPGVFLLIYSLLVVSLLPTLPLNLMAGFLWGTAVGSTLTVIGFSAGALCAFLMARYSNASEYANKYGGKGWRWLESITNEAGWKAVAFARINPAFPSGPINYFFGLTRISLSTYISTTVLFIIPPTILFSAIGESIGSFILGEKITNIMRLIVICSLALTLLFLARLHLKKKLTFLSK